MRDSFIVNRDKALSDQGDGAGKEDPFGLFHDAPLQNLGRISLSDFYSFLQQNGTLKAKRKTCREWFLYRGG